LLNYKVVWDSVDQSWSWRGVCEWRGGEFGDGSGVCERSGGDLCDGSGVCERSGGDFSDWSGVCDWSSSDFSYRSGGDFSYRGSGNDRSSGCFFPHHGVESINWVGNVIDCAPGAVSLDQRVAALDDVSVAALLLALRVAGQTVVHVVGIAVLRMRVEVGVHGLGYHGLGHGGSRHCNRRRVRQVRCWSVGQRFRRAEEPGVCCCYESGEDDQLRNNKFLDDRRPITRTWRIIEITNADLAFHFQFERRIRSTVRTVILFVRRREEKPLSTNSLRWIE
ncbi:unnamed protein product, partial [Heterotrigona itama]